MTAQYEKILELWKARKFPDAISYFSQWMAEILLGQEENEDFRRSLGKFWRLVEVECQKNPEVMFNLYAMLREARKWDDEVFSRRLRISGKAIEDIRSHRDLGQSQWALKCCMNSSLKWPCDLRPLRKNLIRLSGS